MARGMRGGPGTPDPTRFTATYDSLQDLLVRAYELPVDQISGPSFLTTEHYTIVANVPEGATKRQFQGMLQNLLLDRFPAARPAFADGHLTKRQRGNPSEQMHTRPRAIGSRPGQWNEAVDIASGRTRFFRTCCWRLSFMVEPASQGAKQASALRDGKKHLRGQRAPK